MDANKIKKWEEEILDIKRDRHNKEHHSKKRIFSIQWFDDAIEGCQMGKCPRLLEPSKLYAFIDISIEGYIRKMAYYLWEKKDLPNDVARYYKAEELIKKVLHCEKTPKLSEEIFRIDSNEVMDEECHKTQFEGARKRKAYWKHLDFHSWQCDEDYYEAEKFIKKVHAIAQKPSCNQEDVNQLRKEIEEKRNIANALDLYRLCIVRAKCKKNIIK